MEDDKCDFIGVTLHVYYKVQHPGCDYFIPVINNQKGSSKSSTSRLTFHNKNDILKERVIYRNGIYFRVLKDYF